MKVVESKPVNGVIKLECEATAQEVNNALRDAAQAFAQKMGLQVKFGQSVEEAAKEHMGITDLDKIVEIDAIEMLVPHALDRRNLIPAFQPKVVPETPFQRGKKFAFSLNVTVKPTYELTSYEPVEIVVEPFKFDESVIDQQMKEIAQSSVTYVAIDPRPVRATDVVSIDMQCFEDEEEIKALTCQGRTYLMGRNYMPAGFDEGLLGMTPGETKEFYFDAPTTNEAGEVSPKPIRCVVTLCEIDKEVVPTIDDEWVKANIPRFNTVDQLKNDMRRVFEPQQRESYNAYVQQMAVAQLSKRFQGTIADEIYESTRDQLQQNLQQEVQEAGMTWEQFVVSNGGMQQFSMMLMMQTREVLVQGFCLDAVYRHERLSLTEQDIFDACLGMNPQGNPRMMAEEIEAAGRGFALRETAERMKAARFVTQQAHITTKDPAQTVQATEVAEQAAQEAAAPAQEA